MGSTVVSPAPTSARRPSMWEKMTIPFRKGSTAGAAPHALEAPVAPKAMHARKASQATTVNERRPSVVSSKSRSGSVSSSRIWARSSNPEDDDVPPVPAIGRKFSMFGGNQSTTSVSPTSSPPASRRPSYVPRNAAKSFMRSTTAMTSEDIAEVKRAVAEEAETMNRKASTMSAISAMSSSSQASTQVLPAEPVSIAPSLQRNIQLRKDSKVGIEKFGLYSMAGVCDIDESYSPLTATTPSPFIPKTEPIVERSESPIDASRVDSAKTSVELDTADAKAPHVTSTPVNVVV